MKRKTTFRFFLAFLLILTLVPVPSFADTGSADSPNETQLGTTIEQTTNGPAASFPDISGHWAESAIQKWAGLGVVKGDTRGFRPNAPVSRAEMAVILDNLMGYQKKADNIFLDVPDNAWFSDAVLKANAAGILSGNGSGYASPTDEITREEAAVMLARALGVEENAGNNTDFQDAGSIDSWAQPLVFGMEDDHYIGGMAGGGFSPKSSITRAQVVTIIDNAVSQYYTASGTYSDEANSKITGGNCTVIVKASGVTLQKTRIDGDLIISEGVGQGEFTLDSSAVNGKMVVRGGGENSIHVINGAEISGIVSIEKVAGAIRIISNGIAIADLETDAQAILEGAFTNVFVAEGANIELRGTAESISVDAKSEVTIEKGAVVRSLAVDQAAKGTIIKISGTVKMLTTEAAKTEIIAKDTAKITTIEVTTTATGTQVAINENAEITTLKADTYVSTSGNGAPETTTGKSAVTQSDDDSSAASSDNDSGDSGSSSDDQSDTTAPVIVIGEVTRISGTEATVKFTSNEAGQYYYEFARHRDGTSVIDTSGAGKTCAAGRTTISLSIDTEAWDIYIKMKDDSGNLSNTIHATIPSQEIQYALVKAFAAASAFDNPKVKLYTTGGTTRTFYESDALGNVSLEIGDLIEYNIDEHEEISMLSSSGLVFSDTGMVVDSANEVTIDGTTYEISNEVIVYTYTGTEPSAATTFDIDSIENVSFGESIISSASIYLNEDGEAVLLLVPADAVQESI